MDEILALQAALTAAQEQKSQIRLSERNIVELVNKLKSLELLDDTLLYTLNGKEYVTQDRLRSEIKREVKRSGGRVPVVDLQPTLNVDVVHCERQSKALAEDPSSGFTLVEGELMTPAYFDAVAAEVDEELREAGMVGVGDLARRFSLSADLMRKVLSERIGTIVEGRMEGGMLYTPGYVARLTAQLRGAMRAALTPTTRDTLVTNALVADTPAGAELTGSILTDLSKKKATDGDSRGVEDFVADGVFRGGAWHPAVYSRAQTAAVADVYARAGIVTVDEAKRMGVDKSSQKKYFKDLDPSCVALDSCFVSRATLEQLDNAVVDVLSNEGWCEAEMLIPGDLPPSDAPALLAMTATVKMGSGGGGGSGKKDKGGGGGGEGEGASGGGGGRCGVELGEVKLVSELALVTSAFLDAASVKARELGVRAGHAEGLRRQLSGDKKAAAAAVAASTGAGSGGGEGEGKVEGEDGGGGGGGGSGKKGGGGGKKGGGKKKGDRGGDDSEDEEGGNEFAITAEDLDSDDDGGGGRGKRGGKKGGKGGKKGGGKAAAATGGGGKKGGKSGGGGGGVGDDVDDNAAGGGAPTDDDLAAIVSEMAPEASDDFCSAVAKRVRPTALKAFTAAVASASSAAADRRKDRRAAAAAAFEELLPLAYMWSRGAEILSDDIASQRHCCKTHCVPVADLFFRSQADADLDGDFGTAQSLDDNDNDDDKTTQKKRKTGGAFTELTSKQRDAAVGSLPLDARDAAVALARETTTCRFPTSIISALEVLADALGVRLKGGDKKTERSLLHAHKKGMEDRLRQEQEPAAALLLAVSIVFAVTRGRAVALTGRSLAPALAAVSKGGLLSSEEHAFVAAFHTDVVSSLAGGGGGGRGGGADDKVGGGDGADEDEAGEEEGKEKDGDGDGGGGGGEKTSSLAERLAELKRIALECKKVKGGNGGDDE